MQYRYSIVFYWIRRALNEMPNAFMQVFRILKSDTGRVGRFSDFLGVVSVRYFVKYPTYPYSIIVVELYFGYRKLCIR